MFGRNSKSIVYFLVLVISFLVIFVPSKYFNSLKFTAVKGTSLPIRVISFPLREIKKMLFYHRTFDEYIRLRREVALLEGRLATMDEIIMENARLEKLLNLKRELVFSSVAANVVGRDPSNWNATMIIDKGLGDGIRVGLPVVNAFGTVGKIAEVSDNSSKIILVSDPSFSVAALAKRSREVGLVSGTLKGVCRMRYLSADADVKKGDKVITSKLSSSFPEGLLVGEVIEVHSSERSPTLDCIVQPAVSLSQIEEVLVIIRQ